MRIASWNCAGALRSKLRALCALQADVYIVQECENPATCKDPAYKAWAANSLWVGKSAHKGLGVFAAKHMQLSPCAMDAGELALFIPCMVNRMPLLAVWTKDSASHRYRYIGQIWQWLQLHGDFLRQPNALCMGDLNSNACWDGKHPWSSHSDVVRQLESMGLVSIYHRQFQQAHGQESTPTFFMQRNKDKPYHIDYAFAGPDFHASARLHIGACDDWLALSDHVPITLEL